MAYTPDTSFFYSVSSKSYLGICLEILLDRKSLWEQLSQISASPFTWQDPPGLEKISSPTQLLSERSFCFLQGILFRTTLQISELRVKWKLSGHLPLLSDCIWKSLMGFLLSSGVLNLKSLEEIVTSHVFCSFRHIWAWLSDECAYWSRHRIQEV